jgi:hypothetical protein
VSACFRDAFVPIEELLDFFESIRGSPKKLELLDVPDRTLEASLVSLGTARLVALRNKLATDEADIRESDESGRDALSWDRRREVAAEVLIQTKPRSQNQTYVVVVVAYHF